MEIRIVNHLLTYISEYVNIEIRNMDDEVLVYYDGSEEMNEEYNDCYIEDFIIGNGLVTIWV